MFVSPASVEMRFTLAWHRVSSASLGITERDGMESRTSHREGRHHETVRTLRNLLGPLSRPAGRRFFRTNPKRDRVRGSRLDYRHGWHTRHFRSARYGPHSRDSQI